MEKKASQKDLSLSHHPLISSPQQATLEQLVFFLLLNCVNNNMIGVKNQRFREEKKRERDRWGIKNHAHKPDGSRYNGKR